MDEKPTKARKFSRFGGAKGVRGEFYFYFLWCILVSWMDEPIHGKKSRELQGPSLRYLSVTPRYAQIAFALRPK